MPGLGRYPCETCEYVGSNRRMLSRHVAIAHSDKVYKCPLCPFITRYPANWYRHKRGLHGMSKLTTCQVCGFFANSPQELAVHVKSKHPERSQSERVGAANEETSPAGQSQAAGANQHGCDEQIQPNGDSSRELNQGDAEDGTESVQFSLPLNGFFESDPSCSNNNTLVNQNSSSTAMTSLPPGHLSPLKVRRSYCCDLCGLLTGDPREFLYHQRDVHKIKMNVHECTLCIYASKHIQKLQRHYNLVHRQKLPECFRSQTIPRPKPKPVENKDKIFLPKVQAKTQSVSSAQGSLFRLPEPQQNTTSFVTKSRRQNTLKCNACSYQTSNKFLLMHHEKTVHLKRKFFRCLTCGYVTHEKARYTKHMKYHNLPKMKCEFCHFKSAYKWNMDRHMKNHVGGDGEFSCILCNFVTHTKQSLKMHVSNHHDSIADEDNDMFEEDMEGDMIDDDDDDDDPGQLVIDSQEYEWENNCESEPYELEEQAFDFEEFAKESVPAPKPVPKKRSLPVWKQNIMKANHDIQDPKNRKLLRCTECDYTTTWSFEMKKHEENHKNANKRHSCPLCGMKFEHVAWLIKHLYRVHKDNPEAKKIAAAYELIKPSRRRSQPKTAPSPSLVAELAAITGNKTLSHSLLAPKPKQPPAAKPKQSVLSSLLRGTNTTPRYMPILPKPIQTAREPGSYMKSQGEKQHSSSAGDASAKNIDVSKKKYLPTCKFCGYKTKWISEMEKHKRVHSDEKPFSCTKCSYHSKWKGDLTRHLMRHHGMSLMKIKAALLTPKQRKEPEEKVSETVMNEEWQTVDDELDIPLEIKVEAENDEDGPLDLSTTTKGSDSHSPDMSHSGPSVESDECRDDEGEEVDVVADDECDQENSSNNFSNSLTDTQQEVLVSDDEDNSAKAQTKESAPSARKYFCPFCSFNTTTPSRFHVHIVQHYNKKPFMCSQCGYRSNWEWDITKHIRLRKDKEHTNACVLLTDETGKRNYEKYEKYLKTEKSQPAVPQQSSDSNNQPQAISRRSNRSNTPSEATVSKDDPSIRNDNLNADNGPVNIIVTPDLPFSNDHMEESEFPGNENDFQDPSNLNGGDSAFKFYLCKHCNFKHASRKGVIGHLSVHTGVRPFRCRVCGFASNWRHVVVRHVKDSHNGYMNDVEDRISYIQEGFVIRITSVKSDNKVGSASSVNRSAQFNCTMCPYKCEKEVYIKFHMKQHKPRDGAIYQCLHCPYYVKFKKTLVRHMKLHEPPSAQDDAGEIAYEQDELDHDQNNLWNGNEIRTPNSNDEQNHEQNFVEKDGGCGGDDDEEEEFISISFDQLNAPELPTIEPPKLKRHNCENCPYKTDNRTQYLYHKQFHRPNNAAPFKCNLCSYWASMQHLLTQHMKVHNKEKEEAQNRSMEEDFITQPAFKNNLIDENGQISVVLVQKGGMLTKMFKCRFCPMMNKKRANVRVHEKMHCEPPGDGKYICSLCNYKCLGQGSLTNHMKIHQSEDEQVQNIHPDIISRTNDDPTPRKKVFSYFCMRCPAVFKSSSDLYIHKTFHGSSLPFPCPHCDYRAKHKPHLHKHLQVHTLAYVSKRDASFGPPVNSDYDKASEFLEPSDLQDSGLSKEKKVDQMLLLEVADLKMSMAKTKEFQKRLHKCSLCPSMFSKAAVLTYHSTLHGSSGAFKCSQCNYAVSASANLSIHLETHAKYPSTSPVKRSGRVMQCPKCPAQFNKNDRFERHVSLHGKNYRFVCDICDYSVRFAANLSKHRVVHINAGSYEQRVIDSRPQVDSSSLLDILQAVDHKSESSDKSTAASNEATSSKQPTNSENVTSSTATETTVTEEKKVLFLCDRCPYSQSRKDAVQSHQNRHYQKEGYQCPHCDYRSMGSAFLRDHIKSHAQQVSLYHPEAFMSYKTMEIHCALNGTKKLIFADRGIGEKLSDRFIPKVEESDEIYFKGVSSDDTESPYRCKTRFTVPVKTASSGKSDASTKATTSSSMIAIKNPKVVLTDIFSQNKIRSLLDTNLKLSSKKKDVKKTTCPKQDPTKKESDSNSGSEKSSTKSSLIMKIKVENSDDNSETHYTISSNKEVHKSTESNCSDAASDVTLPIADFEDLSTENEKTQAEASPVKEECSEDDRSSIMTDSTSDTKDILSEVVPSKIENDDAVDEEEEEKIIPVSDNSNKDKSPVNTILVCPSDEPEVDFLKKLDTMVNGVNSNSQVSDVVSDMDVAETL